MRRGPFVSFLSPRSWFTNAQQRILTATATPAATPPAAAAAAAATVATAATAAAASLPGRRNPLHSFSQKIMTMAGENSQTPAKTEVAAAAADESATAAATAAARLPAAVAAGVKLQLTPEEEDLFSLLNKCVEENKLNVGEPTTAAVAAVAAAVAVAVAAAVAAAFCVRLQQLLLHLCLLMCRRNGSCCCFSFCFF